MAQAETVRRWQERLRRFDESQIAVAQFCADEGISQPSYYHWRRKLRSSATQATPNSTDTGARFIPVALHPTPATPDDVPQAAMHSRRATTTIELPGGIRIHVQVPVELHRDRSNEQPSGEGHS